MTEALTKIVDGKRIPLSPEEKAAIEAKWSEEEANSIDKERAEMRCSPAQMRLALHRLDLLTQVQAIADSDPEASIVWEYATSIERTSPLIDALGGPNGFTSEQIDDIFRAAMEVAV